MTRVAVLMSGGVDSSVAALLLKNQGYEITGFYLNYTPYCNPQDELDARRVAEILGIKFYSLDITEEFEEKIINYFVKSYENGLTPNPDVFCNDLIKFGIFLDKALNLNFEKIATGHYARILKDENGYHLLAGKDKNKDQSYFLWKIKKDKLEKIIFPIGELTKEEVRKIASENNFPNAFKKGSSGICFVGPVKLREFLNNYLKPKEGLIIDTKGNILGKHPGYFYFTEGQRHGLNIKIGGGPYYVVKKIPEENLIVVAKEGEPVLYTKRIEITEINILEKEILEKEEIFDVRFRYRQPLVKAKLILTNNTEFIELKQNLQNSSVKSAYVEFLEPQKMIAPGQSIVFYKDDLVLGGGIIKRKFD
ncbi:tRNA-specific 2-thiouridylase MnmA [bacterium HR35]|nr:tRNA-specific 2-thiouridylase MnmA [bacterium HR35]